MSTVPPPVSTDGLPGAARPPLRAGCEPVSVTARPVPPDAVVITVRGTVDLFTRPSVRDRLLSHLRDTVPRAIVDLTEVDFFGVAGLTVLLDARKTAVAAGIDLRLVACTRVVLLPLTIAGVDRVFGIHPDLDDALLGPDSRGPGG